MAELKRCPNCGGELTKIHKRKHQYKIECDSDCWTQTGWHYSLEDAEAEWNRLEKRKEEGEDENSV